MELVVATNNAGKLREFEAIFAPTSWRVVRHAAYRDVDEGDQSYADNAALKARTLAAALRAVGDDRAVLGDDSGLEIAALGGRPGVLSARYGGADATWAQRRERLLAEVAASASADRRARFVCALHFVDGDAREIATIGTCDGVLARESRGAAGFSFDPIFELPNGSTFAEVTEEEKNRTSHRARAVAALLRRIG